MAAAVFTRVVIFDERMVAPGGIVHDWCRSVGREYSVACKAKAPRRSGELRRKISFRIRPGSVARKTVEVSIGSRAPHTMYVLHGTTGPIMANGLWKLGGKLRKGRGLRRFRKRVRNPRTGRMKYRTWWVPIKGVHMAVGTNLYPPVVPMLTVDGQRPKPFMREAWVIVAARHPSLPAFPLNL